MGDISIGGLHAPFAQSPLWNYLLRAAWMLKEVLRLGNFRLI